MGGRHRLAQLREVRSPLFLEALSLDKERSVLAAGRVPWKFDLVSSDGSIVGDAKRMKNIAVPAAKWQAIAEYDGAIFGSLTGMRLLTVSGPLLRSRSGRPNGSRQMRSFDHGPA
jgi:hypothetical protein